MSRGKVFPDGPTSLCLQQLLQKQLPPQVTQFVRSLQYEYAVDVGQSGTQGVAPGVTHGPQLAVRHCPDGQGIGLGQGLQERL